MVPVGIHGFAHVGKDTAAKIIDVNCFGEVKKHGWSYYMKWSACRCFHPEATLEEALVWADWVKEEGVITVEDRNQVIGHDAQITGRQFLQHDGSEGHRDIFGEDFWLDVVLPLEPTRDDCDVLVIPDTRYENEAQRVKDCGGEVWEIVRDVEGVEDHPTERRIPEHLIDRTIDNNGDLDALRTKLRRALIEMELRVKLAW